MHVLTGTEGWSVPAANNNLIWLCSFYFTMPCCSSMLLTSGVCLAFNTPACYTTLHNCKVTQIASICAHIGVTNNETEDTLKWPTQIVHACQTGTHTACSAASETSLGVLVTVQSVSRACPLSSCASEALMVTVLLSGEACAGAVSCT